MSARAHTPGHSTSLGRAPDSTDSSAVPRDAARAGGRTAASFLATLLDHDSFRSWDSPPRQPTTATDPDSYRRELAAARERAGTDEAVVTGQGFIDGHAVAVVCSEFGFLAGSIGAASARRLLDAIERATEQRLPLIAAPASGGTRMQEGTAAFLCMPAITAAITRHKAAGLPYVVYLRHPTTGGVLASWASLGHITLAEPGALIGFLGPKVYRALHGRSFPPRRSDR
jgi:acetyl-CoA carboxylase carboxyl transferase subunit beta